MGVNQFWDATVKFEREAPRGADDPIYRPPRGHDKELSDSERAALPSPFEAAHRREHEGAPKPKTYRHGQDALGRVTGKTLARTEG